MRPFSRPLILCVEDDRMSLRMMEEWLRKAGYSTLGALTGVEALRRIKRSRPDLILLDVMLPRMDGYEVCSRLQAEKETSFIPVIFVTSLGHEQDKAKAFALGAVDYLVKPVKREFLLSKIRTHMETNARWERLREVPVRGETADRHPDFPGFKEFLSREVNLPPRVREALKRFKPSQVYDLPPGISISSGQVARLISRFLNLPYLDRIDPERVRLGLLPPVFCRANLVVPVQTDSGGPAFVLCNPFDWQLLDCLEGFSRDGRGFQILVTEPDHLGTLFRDQGWRGEAGGLETRPGSRGGGDGPEAFPLAGSAVTESEIEKHPIRFITDNILSKAVSDRASDIHFEPKEDHTVVRFRIDGEMREIFRVKKSTSLMLISRLKVMAKMDIAEKRRPQDGVFQDTVGGRIFKFRVATTSTPYGESLIVRLLDPCARPRDLRALGMTDSQVDARIRLGNRNLGLLLSVGPTGSGKTTTLYSFLANMDCRARSLMSIEDPVEYTIPRANRQEVNPRAGVTFEPLLKSAMRQDPDILFLGEVRDSFSAKMAMDFASRGHLILTTLHTSNAITPIFRLERLGIGRGVIADSVLAIIAQRLLRRLCSDCRRIQAISGEEADLLSPFADEIPAQVAHSKGCSKCRGTGHRGREGIFEIIEFDQAVSERIRAGVPIAEIREFCRQRGDFLISHHAMEKVKRFLVSPREAQEKVLIEEPFLREKISKPGIPAVPAPGTKGKRKTSILLVEDDNFTQRLIKKILEKGGYEVTLARDGIEALLSLGRAAFDLVLSDVDMPNLDGFRLLEMMNQKGLDAPLLFLTAQEGQRAEREGLRLGAVDFIRKPVEREVLLLRIRRVLDKHPERGKVHGG